MPESGRPRRRAGSVGRVSFIVVLVIAAYVVGAVLLPPVRTASRTVAVVPEMIGLPVRPLSLLVPQPNVWTTWYGSPADRLDVYVPAGALPTRSLPAVVLALGVHPEPIDHPDVVRVAGGISRLGVVVGVAESTALRETRIEPAEPARLADAALVAAAMPEVDPSRLGLAGFSAGASVALIAAADPRVAGYVRFVSNFGGYATAELLLVDVATRTMKLDGRVRPWSTDAGVRHDVLDILLRAVEPAAERRALQTVLEPIVAADEPPIGPDPAVASRFTGDALVAYRLFTAPDRETAAEALSGASPALSARLAAISPLSFVDRIEATVFTLHGEADTAIPISHAVALDDALSPELRGRFTRFGRFAHEQPGRDGLALEDVPDVWQLTLHLHEIVATLTE